MRRPAMGGARSGRRAVRPEDVERLAAALVSQTRAAQRGRAEAKLEMERLRRAAQEPKPRAPAAEDASERARVLAAVRERVEGLLRRIEELERQV